METGNERNFKQMADYAESYACSKALASTKKVIALAVIAGVFVGFAFVFYITVTTGTEGLGWGLSRLIGGLMFSTALILILVCGGELFTSTILSIIPCASGKLGFSKMVGYWLKVYIGNFAGALILVGVIIGSKLHQLDDGQWGLNALNVASHKLEHDFMQAFFLGLLCNLMVCLATWLTFSTKSVGTKAALVMLPIALLACAGFEHVIANMFMVPLGIAIKLLATPEFWQNVGAQAGDFANLTVVNFLSNNVLPVTLGNITGGVVVGLSLWGAHSSDLK